MNERLVQLDLTDRATVRMSRLSSVSVRDILVDADIGIHAHEIGHPQPLVISVTLEIDGPRGDRIDETIDYNGIVALAEALGKQRIGLIETFAHRLASDCLDVVGVRSADVTVEKPRALENGVASTRLVIAAALSPFRCQRSRPPAAHHDWAWGCCC